MKWALGCKVEKNQSNTKGYYLWQSVSKETLLEKGLALGGGPGGRYTPAWIRGILVFKLGRSGGMIWVATGCNNKFQGSDE